MFKGENKNKKRGFAGSSTIVLPPFFLHKNKTKKTRGAVQYTQHFEGRSSFLENKPTSAAAAAAATVVDG